MKTKLMSVLAMTALTMAVSAVADEKCNKNETRAQRTETTTTTKCVGGDIKGSGVVVSGGANGSACTTKTVTDKYPVCKPNKTIGK